MCSGIAPFCASRRVDPLFEQPLHIAETFSSFVLGVSVDRR